MTYYTEAHQKVIKELWERYVQSHEAIPETIDGLRSEISDSWKRSKQHGIDPNEVKDNRVKPNELKETLKRRQHLIKIAHSYMENLYSFIKGSNCKVVLSDEYGTVIDSISDGQSIKKQTEDSGLNIGANRNEEYAGTNGIGTCLYLRKPIQVLGAEHYIKPHHNYVCSAAPIFDEDGILIGCLDVVGQGETIHPHTLGMVCAAVDGIEKAMKMQRAYDEIAVINKQLSTAVQALKSGIIMIDSEGKITQYNQHAINILNLPNNDLSGKSIQELFIDDEETVDYMWSTGNFNRKEVSLTAPNGKLVNLLMSCHVIENHLGNRISTVLVFDEMQGIHKMVSKMSGFTAKYTFDSIIGDSKAIRDVKALGDIASQSDSNVLILGESGTGKELIAQSIHNASSRRSGPFIGINCGSIPKGLIESELFGYEGGSFTGAKKDGYPGKFELAEGGTIFLDEIGDMPLDMQASLLRVTQNREIVRVGGSRSKPVDVRIMAATNVNLVDRIRENNFRSDLYYRLNVLSIVIPPLRERPEDILLLAGRFMNFYNMAIGKNVVNITQKAKKMLTSYDWPGNVRELENVIERAINLAQGDVISEKELSYDIFFEKVKQLGKTEGEIPSRNLPPVQSLEYRLILEAIEEYKGNLNKVTNALGIPRRTLYRRLEKYGIDPDKYRN